MRKLLGLHIGCADEVPGIRIVWVDLDHVLESFDRGLRVAGVFREQAQAVPGVGIFRILLQGFFERNFGLIHFLQVEVGDAFIHARNRKLGIGR